MSPYIYIMSLLLIRIMYGLTDKPLSPEQIKEMIRLHVKYYSLMTNKNCLCNECRKWRTEGNVLVSFAYDIGLPTTFDGFDFKTHESMFGGHPNIDKLVKELIEEKNKLQAKNK